MSNGTNAWDERDERVAHFEPLFSYRHLPPRLQMISQLFSDVALAGLGELKDGPELEAGLRKLVEAKDCFVRQAVLDSAEVPVREIKGSGSGSGSGSRQAHIRKRFGRG